MENIKLNILPVPTFSSLGVNFAEREIEISWPEHISVGANEQKQIIRYIDSESDAFTALDLNIESGADVKLVQVFERTAPLVSKLDIALGDNAKLDLVQIYIGGSDTVSEIAAKLDGRKAVFNADIAMKLDGKDKIDLNLVSEQYGKKTVSEIKLGAVLGGEAKKTFKGTIDFKEGAVGAKGSEHEDALLLSEDVVSKTVPVILCAEEDVEGNHGATVGRLDESHVFYLRSRGIDEKKIYELMARSKLKQAIVKTDDEQTKSRIYNALGWGERDE